MKWYAIISQNVGFITNIKENATKHLDAGAFVICKTDRKERAYKALEKCIKIESTIRNSDKKYVPISTINKKQKVHT